MNDIGHNNPPTDEDILRDTLVENNVDLVDRVEALMDSMTRTPAVVGADNAGAVGDFIKQLSAANKEATARRVATKEPYLAGGRVVDGFFKGLGGKVEDAKKDMEARLNIHLRVVAAEERAAREEEASIQREEAERAAKEAADKAAAMVTDADVDAAVEAETNAAQAAADSAKAAAEATAKAADLSRTRGDHGSVSSLRTFWTFSDVERATIDLEVLRHHIPEEALEKAVRSFVKAGGRELAGARIFEDTKTVVR
ncbi:hypothetical protein [uncultured Sneathiella sp.]|uniref:hypothetical protein n=1 Tax=uncultured Sneathiella sp. TaxID=879315 RepID=UPI0030EC6780